MEEKQLFEMALGVSEPWFIADITFDVEKKRLDLHLDFKRGSKFLCPECGGGELCSVHDTHEKSWRHLDFFQHQAYLTARVPRINCQTHGVRLINVPWARPSTGFTLLFEALAFKMCQQMAVSAAARLMQVNPNSVWRILGHYVEKEVDATDYSEVVSVGVDECARQKGHHYITTFCDLDKSRVVFVADGRKKSTFKEFREFLEKRGIKAEQISQLAMDMWKPFSLGAEENFPKASITFDRYHVMTLLNRAIDEVRREETRTQPLLKGSRYIWLKNSGKLNQRQRADFERLAHLDSKTGRAYQIKLTLQRFWQIKGTQEAEAFLKKWYFWATHSRLPPIIKAAKTIKRHWNGIVRFIESRITTGIVEGLNSKIKTAMKRAYGFKSFQYLRTIIYLVAGKLDITLPTRC
jgi:transposase